MGSISYSSWSWLSDAEKGPSPYVFAFINIDCIGLTLNANPDLS